MKYCINSKAHKVYNSETKKVIISQNVTFDEEGIQDWSLKAQR